MASKRQLKGDIKFIAEELVSECIAYIMINSDVNLEETEAIVNDVVEYYSKALIDINAVRKLDKKERGDNLKAIRNDLGQKVPEFIARIAKLCEKK